MSERFLQNLVSGISMGSIYALAAVGFNIIYNATGIINFAQGEFVMLGGILMVYFTVILKWPLLLAFLVVALLVACVGLILERGCVNPLKNPSVLVLVMITIAASILIKGITMFIAGKEIYRMEYFSGENTVVNIAGARAPTQTFWVLGVLGIVAGGLIIFFNKTLMGKAMRACAFDRTASSLMGIPTRRIIMFSFFLSAAIGGMAGAVIVPISMMDFHSGAMFGVKGFGAAVLGGLGNNIGAVVAGLLLGTMESLTAGYISSHYKDAIPLVVLLLILFVKPSGLFGSEAAGRLKKF